MFKNFLYSVMTASLLSASMANAKTAPEQEFLTQNGLQGKTVNEMIDYIDQLPQQRPLPYKASVTSTELKFTDGENSYVYPLEGDFYLSIAPFITYTHDCFNHSLSGCKAELTNTTYHVTVKDDAEKVIFDQTVVSYSNGFYGLWLPRNISGTVEVEYDGKKGFSSFTTNASGQTCMTTIHLR